MRGSACGRGGEMSGFAGRECTPHFSFWGAKKRNGPCTVQREKTLGRKTALNAPYLLKIRESQQETMVVEAT